MTIFAHERAAKTIEELPAGSHDVEIAVALAHYLTCGKTDHFTLVLNHNAKIAPCPVRIDAAMKGKCVVTLDTIEAAKSWIIDALTRGYEVSCSTYKGNETRSIAQERRSMQYRQHMADYRAQRARGEEEEEDDIPF